MQLKEKKLLLGELLTMKEAYYKVYSQITDFKEVLELEEHVIEPIDKIVKAYDKKYKQLGEELKKDSSKQEELDKALNEMLNSEVTINLMEVSKEIAEKAQLNVFEYRIVKEFVV